MEKPLQQTQKQLLDTSLIPIEQATYTGFFENPSWAWDVGLTAKIRDAEISLTQGNTKSSYPNLGFVPLLYLAAEHHIV